MRYIACCAVAGLLFSNTTGTEAAPAKKAQPPTTYTATAPELSIPTATVQFTTAANMRRLQVSFVVPNDPAPPVSNIYNNISIYAFRIVNGQRTDVAIAQVAGAWTANNPTAFSVDVPTLYFVKANNWEVRFCIGNPGGCKLGPNLVKDAP
jgi:hypothetical protein